MRRYLMLFPVLFSAACFLVTEPRIDAQMTIDPTTVSAEVRQGGTVTWLQFELPVRITNAGERTVRFERCFGLSLETADGSTTVWRPVCDLVFNPAVVGRGETIEFPVMIMAALSGPGGPDWEGETIAGTYRLRIAFTDEARKSHFSRTSNPVELTIE